MQIYQNKYLEINYFKDEQFFNFKWYPTTVDMLASEYKDEIKNYAQLLAEYNPYRLLVDDQEMQFVIYPELQEWIAEYLFPRAVSAGMRFIAIVVSKDFYAQLATEQTIAENPNPDTLNTCFFEDSEKAMEWLMKQEKQDKE